MTTDANRKCKDMEDFSTERETMSEGNPNQTKSTSKFQNQIKKIRKGMKLRIKKMAVIKNRHVTFDFDIKPKKRLSDMIKELCTQYSNRLSNKSQSQVGPMPRSLVDIRDKENSIQ